MNDKVMARTKVSHSSFHPTQHGYDAYFDDFLQSLNKRRRRSSKKPTRLVTGYIRPSSSQRNIKKKPSTKVPLHRLPNNFKKRVVQSSLRSVKQKLSIFRRFQTPPQVSSIWRPPPLIDFGLLRPHGRQLLGLACI